MINEQIRDKEVRLISADGEQLGIMSSRDAMKLAQEAELDLVKIAPGAKPPVCKIIDYGKYRYELARKEKEAKKKQKTIDVKEVRLSPNIDTNDLNTKAGAARKFLTKGDRVKVTLRFRGREMTHINYSKQILDSFFEKVEDIIADIREGMNKGNPDAKFVEIPDRLDALHYAVDHAQEGDLIAVIGKGHETYRDREGVKTPFLERELLEEYAQQIGLE